MATLKTAAPVVAPNMKPAYEQLAGDFSKAFSAAQNFGRMNPEVVQQALGQGGALSNTFGFQSAQEVAGLSPQELLALTQGQTAFGQMQQAQNVYDSITGGRENRDAQRQLAGALFQGGAQNLYQGASLNTQVVTSNRSIEQSGYNTQFSADRQSEENKLNRDVTLAGQRETARHNKEIEKDADENRAQRERELKYINNAMSNPRQAAIGLPFDKGMQEHYTQQAAYWDKAGKSETHVLNQALNQLYSVSIGHPWGKPFDVNNPVLQKQVLGADQLVLRPDGYYGTKTVNGKTQFVSMKPVLPLPGMSFGKASSQSGAYSSVPRYSPE